MPGQSHAGQQASCNGSHRSSQLTADGQSELTADDSDDNDQRHFSSSGTKHQEQKQPQQQAQRTAWHDDSPLQEVGTPGPGAYRAPSSFKPAVQLQNPSSYVLASNITASIKGRNWPAPDTTMMGKSSPGPLAYAPVLEAESLKRTAPRAVFSAADRERQGRLYLGSEELDRSAKTNTPGPGPAAYRVGCGRLPGRQAPGLPAAPRSAFAVSHSAPKHVTAAVALAKKKCDRRNLGVQEDYPATAISVGYNGRDSKDYYERPSSSPASVIQQAAVSRDLDADVTRSPADVATANRQATSAPRGRTKPPSSDRHSRSKSIDRILCSSVSDVTCLGTGGQKWSFGPPGGVEKGRARRRSQEAVVFISPQHAAIDAGVAGRSQTPGAAAYSIGGKLQLLSTHAAAGTASFGSERRYCDATTRLYLSPEHVKSDPSLSYSPGPGTAASDLPGAISAAGASMGQKKGPRFGSPPRSPTAKQPVIGKQFELQHAGQDSPGPACYDSVAAALAGSVLGDRRTAHFGTGSRGTAAAAIVVVAPGPGAYKCDEGKLSTHVSSPAYSLGATGHKDTFTTPKAHATPGVGTYSISLADKQCLRNAGAAIVSGKLPHGGTETTACSPGPAAYSPTGDMGYEASIDWDIRWGAMSRPGSRYATCREQQQQDCLATQQGPLSLDVQDRQRQARKQQQQADEEYDSVELVNHELEQPENDGVGQANIKGSHKLELLSIPTHADGCSPTGFQSAHSSTRRSAQLNCSGSDLASIDLPRSDSRRAVAFPSRQTTGSSSNRSAAVYRSETGDCSSAEQRTLATDSTQPPVHGGHHYKPSCQRKGFSILGKDTRQQQVVSPGPAAYEVHEGLTVRNAGAAKLVGRPSDRLVISKLHEESQVGVDSPGPGAYDAGSLKALSQHKNSGRFTFGSGTRPDMAKTRF